MKMIEITVNGDKIQCEEGEPLLGILRSSGYDIPSLCDHEAVKPKGICGICKVEIATEDKPDKKKYMPSCIFKSKTGQIIETENEGVISQRAEAVKKLLALAPGDIELVAFAVDVGVNVDEIEPVEGSEDCVKCGLCVRVCTEVIGCDWDWKPAKGYPRESAPPDKCIGCLACVYVCPTDCIGYEKSDDETIVWGKSFEMHKCKVCGAATHTVAQKGWLVARNDLREDYYDLCEEHKRIKTAGTQAKLATY